MPSNNNKNSSCSSMSCPVCAEELPFLEPHSSRGSRFRCSHNARVIYLDVDSSIHNGKTTLSSSWNNSAKCAACLQVSEIQPMICLECGHVICQTDFWKLGGTLVSSTCQEMQDEKEQAAAAAAAAAASNNNNNNNQSEFFLTPELLDIMLREASMQQQQQGHDTHHTTADSSFFWGPFQFGDGGFVFPRSAFSGERDHHDNSYNNNDDDDEDQDETDGDIPALE